MFCESCGANIPDNSAQCPSCGKVYAQQNNAYQNNAYGSPMGNPAANPQHKKIAFLLVVIGAAVAAIACFLPYYTVSFWGMSESVSYISGDGKIVLGLVAVSIVLGILKQQSLLKFSTIPSAIGLVVWIIDWSDVKEVTSTGLGSLSIGAYLCIIGLIAAIVGGVLGFVWKNDF